MCEEEYEQHAWRTRFGLVEVCDRKMSGLMEVCEREERDV